MVHVISLFHELVVLLLCVLSLIEGLVIDVLQLLCVVLELLFERVEARHKNLVDRVALLLILLFQFLVLFMVLCNHLLIFFV